MPKYIIERELVGAGNLSAIELHALAQKACEIIDHLGPHIQWVESFVTSDKMYCIYLASTEGFIREHARLSGFPLDRISEIHSVIDPTTAGALSC